MLASLSGCPSPCTLDPSPAEHPQLSLTHTHGSAHTKPHSKLLPVGGKAVWLLTGVFQASALTAPQRIPHPGSPALQDTLQAGKGSAIWAQVNFQGLTHIPCPSGALRCLVWANCGMFLQEGHDFPSHHAQAAPGAFPAWTCIWALRDPTLPSTPPPAGTNLHKASTFWGTSKTQQNKKLQKSLSTKWQRQKMRCLGREWLQRGALHFPAAVRTTYLCEWWWLHENTSAEPSHDSSDVNRGRKQTEAVHEQPWDTMVETPGREEKQRSEAGWQMKKKKVTKAEQTRKAFIG